MPRLNYQILLIAIVLAACAANSTAPNVTSTPSLTLQPTDTPTETPIPTPTETIEQQINRVAEAEFAKGANVNDIASWTHTPEGHHFAEVVQDPNSWNDSELSNLNLFMHQLRLAEYDKIIDQGQDDENFNTLRLNVWNAVAGFMSDENLANEILKYNPTQLKDFLHNRLEDKLTSLQHTYLEIIRQASNQQPIRLSPVEIAEFEFDQNHPLFDVWKKYDNNGLYGFEVGGETGLSNKDQDVTIPLFGRDTLTYTQDGIQKTIDFKISRQKAAETFATGRQIYADFVGLVDLSTKDQPRFAHLNFMRANDTDPTKKLGSPHFWLQEVVFEGDNSMVFGPDNLYIGSWTDVPNIIKPGTIQDGQYLYRPPLTFHTYYRDDTSEAFKPYTKEVALSQLSWPPTFVVISPSQASAPVPGFEFPYAQFSFIDAKTGLPVLGADLTDSTELLGQTGIHFRNRQAYLNPFPTPVPLQ